MFLTVPCNDYLRSYSVISPGDTVNVIGEFDDEGKCNVDHENNFLIVHPDILVSGTRVSVLHLYKFWSQPSFLIILMQTTFFFPFSNKSKTILGCG